MKMKLCHLRNWLYAFFFSLRLKKKYYICNRGIGDTAIFLSRLNEYENAYKKKVNLVIPQNQVALVNGYGKYVDSVIVLPTNKLRWLIDVTADRKWKNMSFILPEKAIDKLSKNSTLFELMGETLGVNSDKYTTPEFLIPIERVSQIKKELGIEKCKFVIIAPDAVSVSGVSETIWHRIVSECHENGMLVLENVASQSQVKFGDKSIFLQLDEMYEIAKEADAFLSVRSGLCDLLVFSKVPMTVFYPSEDSLKLYSFKTMPFSDNVKEVVLKDGKESLC